jgi:hypothetical protein
MRFAERSIIGVVLVALVILDFDAGPSRVRAATFQSEAPKILSVRVKGKKLILVGENFSDGAVILVNGEPQKTRNDPESPSTTLIANKAGNAIPASTAVIIQVQSANSLTDRFPFFNGRVVTFDDVGKPILLRVGDRFLLFLQRGSEEFSSTVLDPTILMRVTGVDIPGSQGVFEAVRSGTTTLTVEGELPCHKATPPCLAPTFQIKFSIIVE